ncbi:MAG: DUF3800 domain-containing protein [Cryobacterium sp.]|nr:DUF3800 domain-containing protein [Cryobacterium sp.]
MLYAYVDESERDEDFYFLGALVGTQEQFNGLTSALDAIVAKHAEAFPALANIELHASHMMRATDEPWRSLPLRIRFAIYRDVVEAIRSSEVRIFVEGVDIGAQAARGYPVLTPARELAFSHLFERINDCGREVDCAVKIIADEHHTAPISRSNFASYQIHGTYGYRSSTLANIDPQIDFISSATSRPLQASDHVTYIYNRLRTIVETNPKADSEKRKLWRTIEAQATWPVGRARIWP